MNVIIIPFVILIIIWILEISLSHIYGEDNTFILSILVYLLTLLIIAFYIVVGIIWVINHIYV
jgi:hypothetical protein